MKCRPRSGRQADASFRAAIRSPANGISGVCASGSSRLPRRKRMKVLLLPPPLASPAKPLATIACAARSTPRSRMHQPGWRNRPRTQSQSAAPDWLMYSGAPRGASRARDSRQWLRRRRERRREEQPRQTLATGEPRETGSAHAGDAIGRRADRGAEECVSQSGAGRRRNGRRRSSSLLPLARLRFAPTRLTHLSLPVVVRTSGVSRISTWV